LKSYAQTYGNFTINSVTVHFLTNVPTSTVGDLMIYYENDPENPFPDFSNDSFLPYAMSNPNTLLGPLWTNHSMHIVPRKGTYSTLLGASMDVDEVIPGNVWIMTRSSSAIQTGNIVLDYDITFSNLQLNPLAGLLPISRAKYHSTCIGITATAVTLDTTGVQLFVQGKNVSDGTATAPTGNLPGDIYRVVFNYSASEIVNAAWTACTAAIAFRRKGGGETSGITIDDGTTLYGMWKSSDSSMWLYPTFDNAVNDTHNLLWAVTDTVTLNACVSIALVGSATGVQTTY
jgi:hypothetical protein